MKRKRVFTGSCRSSVLLDLAWFDVFSGFKREGHTVDTEPLTRWIWSIIEHVTQVGITLHETHTKITSLQKMQNHHNP